METSLQHILDLGGMEAFEEIAQDIATDIDRYSATKHLEKLTKGRSVTDWVSDNVTDISPEEREHFLGAKFGEADFWPGVAYSISNEVPTMAEDILKFIIDAPFAATVGLAQYSYYQFRDGTEYDMKVQAMVDAHPLIGLVHLIADEKGRESASQIIDQLGSPSSWTAGGIVLTITAIAGLLAGGAGAVRLAARAGSKVVREGGRASRIAQKVERGASKAQRGLEKVDRVFTASERAATGALGKVAGKVGHYAGEAMDAYKQSPLADQRGSVGNIDTLDPRYGSMKERVPIRPNQPTNFRYTKPIEVLMGDEVVTVSKEGDRFFMGFGGDKIEIEGNVLVGRSDQADVKFASEHDSVSGQHLRIQVTPDERVIIEDLGSTNGTNIRELPPPSNRQYIEKRSETISEYFDELDTRYGDDLKGRITDIAEDIQVGKQMQNRSSQDLKQIKREMNVLMEQYPTEFSRSPSGFIKVHPNSDLVGRWRSLQGRRLEIEKEIKYNENILRNMDVELRRSKNELIEKERLSKLSPRERFLEDRKKLVRKLEDEESKAYLYNEKGRARRAERISAIKNEIAGVDKQLNSLRPSVVKKAKELLQKGREKLDQIKRKETVASPPKELTHKTQLVGNQPLSVRYQKPIEVQMGDEVATIYKEGDSFFMEFEGDRIRIEGNTLVGRGDQADIRFASEHD